MCFNYKIINIVNLWCWLSSEIFGFASLALIQQSLIERYILLIIAPSRIYRQSLFQNIKKVSWTSSISKTIIVKILMSKLHQDTEI